MAGPAPRRRRVPLDQERIVSAAVTVAARSGIDSLTMPVLAEELGVSLGAAYHHLSGKEELLTLVAQRVFAEIQLPDPDVGNWAERLRQLFLDTAETLRRYPGLELRTLPLPPEVRGTTHTARFVVEQLRSAGLDDEGIDIAFTAIWAFFAGLTPLLHDGQEGRQAMVAELRSGGGRSTRVGDIAIAGAVDVLLDGIAVLAGRTGRSSANGDGVR